MAPYDDESSSGDDGDYTETTTLLGYASREPTEDAISQLGGYPSWLDSKRTPSASLARCKICNELMTLLLQLNGDMPSRFPTHERRLYLFGCRRKPCRHKQGSVRGFRGTRVFKSSEAAHKQAPSTTSADKGVDLGSAIFGRPSSSVAVSANPFAMNRPGAAAQSNPFASPTPTPEPEADKRTNEDEVQGLAETFASKARLTTPSSPEAQPVHELWPPPSAFPDPYSRYALDAEYEALASDESSIPSQARLDMDVDGGAGGSSSAGGSSKEDKELFESSMDKTFQRFADRLSHNPEQVLRYEFDGTPLLYSSNDDVARRLGQQSTGQAQSANAKVVISSTARGIPSCSNCGARRTFELQLTPHAITMLEEDEPMSAALDGMDWGTVFLFVCSADCTKKTTTATEGVSYLEEWVGVQWEELQSAAAV